MGKLKGKINKDGALEIERAGKPKRTQCRRNVFETIPGTADRLFCSDDCSLFGEPDQETYYDLNTDEEIPTGRTRLGLCGRTWIFTEFEDER